MRYRLKIAVEAAQAYNRVKPPHQTVGDAVTFALAQAAGNQVQDKGNSYSINISLFIERGLAISLAALLISEFLKSFGPACKTDENRKCPTSLPIAWVIEISKLSIVEMRFRISESVEMF